MKKIFVKFITAFIPFKKLRKRTRERLFKFQLFPSGTVVSRTACLGNFTLENIDLSKYKVINHQKNRVDYCLLRYENSAVACHRSDVEKYIPNSYLQELVLQQKLDIFSHRRVRAVIMDSYSEMVDQLFISKLNDSRFCACYRDVLHENDFEDVYECKNLLKVEELEHYYRLFFKKLVEKYGNIPIIFLDFPTKYDERPKFKQREAVIVLTIKKLMSEFNNLRLIVPAFVENHEIDPAVYHFSRSTYYFLAKQIIHILNGDFGFHWKLLRKHVPEMRFADNKPLYADDYHAVKTEQKKYPALAVVMQGGICYNNDFTLETIKLYRKTFKNCTLILSTWAHENEGLLKQIENLGCIVLRNTRPEVKCFDNTNYQIKSTQAGLKKAKELGASYVIKTRTDQRMYETQIPTFLFNLLKLFPKDPAATNQKQRLVSLSLNTFKYRLYDISDMFLFGTLEDVMNFWSMDYERRLVLPKFANWVEFAKLEPCEIGATVKYLRKMGEKLDFTLKNSWEMYKKYFCVIDTTAVGLVWPKYTDEIFRWRNFFGNNEGLEELTFKEWVNIYEDLDNMIPNETFVANHNFE